MDNRIYQNVFEANKKWVKQKKSENADFVINLAKEQHPDFLFIGCSDSMVHAN